MTAEQEVYKPTVCLDFDGVIHSYDRGWQGGALYGEIVPGFLDWAVQAQKLFTLTVYSSRSKELGSTRAMAFWIADKATADGWQMDELPTSDRPLLVLKRDGIALLLWFAHQKPSAFVTIDDRGIQFRGDWTAPELKPEVIVAFEPWNASGAPPHATRSQHRA